FPTTRRSPKRPISIARSSSGTSPAMRRRRQCRRAPRSRAARRWPSPGRSRSRRTPTPRGARSAACTRTAGRSDMKKPDLPSSQPPALELSDVRRRIDTVDEQLLGLLAERAELVAFVAEAKRENGLATVDPERENAVLRRLL